MPRIYLELAYDVCDAESRETVARWMTVPPEKASKESQLIIICRPC